MRVVAPVGADRRRSAGDLEIVEHRESDFALGVAVRSTTRKSTRSPSRFAVSACAEYESFASFRAVCERVAPPEPS